MARKFDTLSKGRAALADEDVITIVNSIPCQAEFLCLLKQQSKANARDTDQGLLILLEFFPGNDPFMHFIRTVCQT